MDLNGTTKDRETEKEAEESEKENTNRMDVEDDENLSKERPVPLVATCFGSGIKNVNLAIR